MKNRRADVQSWEGKNLRARVLYSRAGVAQHTWIENENGAVLIDTGDGLIRDLISNDLDPGGIRGVIFTHGHFDHVGGLYSLLGFLRMIGRKEPLPIVAPDGCTEVFSLVKNFERCYPDTIPFEIFRKEIRSQQVIRIAGMTIKAYAVVHCGSIEGSEILDRIPAMGYRISHKGETIAVSGDTGFCPSLTKLAKGADLAIIEAGYKKSTGVDREVLERVHLSEDLAKKIGRLAKDFVLVHRGEGQ
ncbi:MAG: ribonuclease Z [Candidatus Zixiibacteriota bacterium]|nr:MAG: ribonuclease Z [candidate division Zixibacteria bacterium]